MLRIGAANKIADKKQNINFKAQSVPVTYPQTQNLQNVTPDYNVKVPTSYQKGGVFSLPYGYQGHFYTLSNGQRVMIVPKQGETVVKTYVATGSMNEPDNVRGISHYIEHNLFNGSEGLEAGEFFKTVDDMGAVTNASTSMAYTDYFITSNLLKDGDLEKKIKIHAAMLEAPKFTEEMLKKEKGIVNSEINIYLGDADTIASNTTLKNLYNIKSNSGDLVAGTTQNIDRLTRDDVVDYYNNNYYPANMVTVITGEVNPDETINLISKYFSGTNKTTHPRKFEELSPIQKTIRQDIKSDKTNATKIVLGFDGPQNQDLKSRVCLEIIENILMKNNTGRLSKKLKAYNSYAYLGLDKMGARPQDKIAVLITADTTEENCEKVLQEIFNQVHSVLTNQNYDLEAHKKAIINDYSERFEESFRINEIVGKSMMDGTFNYVNNYEDLIRSITPQDIINTAYTYLNLNKTAITVMHPDKKESGDISFTGAIDKQAINPIDVKKYRMSNNFEIITNNSKTNTGKFELTLKTDTLAKAKPAASMVLDELLKEGSMFKTDEQLGSELLRDAITVKACANSNSLGAVGYFGAQDMDKALQSAIEILYNPRFTQDTFETVKSRIETDLLMSEKSAFEKRDKEIFGKTVFGYTRDDILKSLKTLSLDDVKDLYSQLMSNPMGQIVVTAPFERQPELNRTVFSNIGRLPVVRSPKITILDTYKPITETKVLTDIDTKNQAEILETYTYKYSENLKDRVTISLMNHILGGSASSRLFNDLREKQQLAYGVGSRVTQVGNTGMMTLSIGTTTENKEAGVTSYDNIQKSIEGFNKHIKKITTEKVTPEELESAKLNYKHFILCSNETGSGRNNSLADSFSSYYGPLECNEILKIVDSITAEDIYNAANYVFKGKPNYSILATENTLKANKEYLEALQK